MSIDIQKQLESKWKFKPELGMSEKVLYWPTVRDPQKYRQCRIDNWEASILMDNLEFNGNLMEFSLWHYAMEGCGDPKTLNHVYFFDPLFYPHLKKLEKQSSSERYIHGNRWISDVSIFSKKFIIFPINESNIHWNMISFVRPYLVFQNLFFQFDPKDEKTDLPCVLIMDSLCTHRNVQRYMPKVNILIDFLVEDWVMRSCTALQRATGEVTFREERAKWRKVPVLILPSPQQPNSIDCGVYTILNIKNIMKDLPSSTSKDISNQFYKHTSQNWYTHTEVQEERDNLYQTIHSLIDDVEGIIRGIDLTGELSDDEDSIGDLILTEFQLKIFYEKNVFDTILSFLHPIHPSPEELKIQKLLIQDRENVVATLKSFQY